MKTISLIDALKTSDYEKNVKNEMSNLLMKDFGKNKKFLFKQTSKIALPNYIIIVEHILKVSLKGKNYDIPILIYFPDSFPLCAPEIYLKKISRHIQINKSIPNYFISKNDLRVNFLLYKKWKKVASSIHEIIDYLIDIFNRFFPLFSCKEENNFSGYCQIDYKNSILIENNNENNIIKNNEKNFENNNNKNNGKNNENKIIDNDKNNNNENNNNENNNNENNNNENKNNENNNNENNNNENNYNNNENNFEKNIENKNNENKEKNNEKFIDKTNKNSSIITPDINDNDIEKIQIITPGENDQLNTPTGDFDKDSIFDDDQIKIHLITKLNKTLKMKIEKRNIEYHDLYNKLIDLKNKINNEINNLNPILEQKTNENILKFQKDLEIISKEGNNNIKIIDNFNNLNIIDKSNQLIQIMNPKYLQRKIKIKTIDEFILHIKKAISERIIKISDIIMTVQKLNYELFKLRIGLYKYSKE